MTDFEKVKDGQFEANIDIDIKAAFRATFADKDGKDIEYFRACIIGNRGLKEVAITKELFQEIDGHLPAVISCTAIVNLLYSKIKLDSLH